MAEVKKLKGSEVTKLIPFMEQFNKIAHSFINILNKKIQRTEKELGEISIMINKIKPREVTHTISIQTVDMNTTSVSRKGEMKYNQKMDWEKEYRNRDRGTLL